MPDQENSMASVVRRLITGDLPEADVSILRQALQTGRATASSGLRSVAIGGDAAQSIILTGDQWQQFISVVQADTILVGGLNQLATDYGARIQNFLVEYLGSPGHPVPFGGRKAEIDGLNAWLHDQHAPPYLLLTAPAGRGKSALLAQWSTTVLAQGEIDVAYVPISVRFSTNLAGVVFPALVARLAAIQGEQPPKGDTPIEVWRGVLTDYLSRPLTAGRGLLVIVDGLDEAAGWKAGADLFPLVPPSGLRIVASARFLAGDADGSSWLRRLGWERPGLAVVQDLAPLTAEGVADVLRRMGFPLEQLGTRVDIVRELHRLSEGDPLLVRLYVDDLWSRGESATRLQPQDLSGIKPGLEGYFSRWWDDQRSLWGNEAPLRERPVQVFLTLLACALGPLSQEDVLSLAPPELNLTTWYLEEVLRHLSRFVLGDGRQQGYTFSHPKLRAYFRNRLSVGELHEMETRFIEWGAQAVAKLDANRMVPGDASPYMVQYYGVHLQQAGSSPDQLLTLVSNSWREAWEMLEGTYAGFLNDVERAKQQAQAADVAHLKAEGDLAPYVGATIRCVLCRASIASLALSTPAALIRSLLAKNEWTPHQALAHAQQVPNALLREEILGDIAVHAAALGRHEDAFNAAEKIENAKLQVQVARQVASQMAEPYRTRLLQRALETLLTSRTQAEARNFEEDWFVPTKRAFGSTGVMDTYRRSERKYSEGADATLFGMLAPCLKGPLIWQAAALVKALSEESTRAHMLALLSQSLPDGSQRLAMHREALTGILRMRASDEERITALKGIVPYLPLTLLQEALEPGWRLKDVWPMAGKLVQAVAARSVALGAIEPAFKLMREITNEPRRVQMLKTLAPQLPSSASSWALAMVEEITDKQTRVELLALLAPSLSETQCESRLGEALVWIMDFPEQYPPSYSPAKNPRATALIALAPHLPSALIGQALQLAVGLKRTDEHGVVFKWRALAALACRVGELGQPAKGMAMALAVGDSKVRSEAIAKLAPYLPEVLLRDLLRAIDSDPTLEHVKVPMFQALLPRLSKYGYPSEAFSWALTLANEYDFCDVLEELVSHLPEHMYQRVQEVIFGLSDSMSAGRPFSPRRTAIVTISRYLSSPQLKQALRVSREIHDNLHKAKALSALAVQLAKLGYAADALEWVRGIEDEQCRSWALIGMSTYLTDQLLPSALLLAQQNTDKLEQVQIVSALAPAMSPESGTAVLWSALRMVREQPHAEYRDASRCAKMLISLASALPAELMPEVIGIARDLEYPDLQATVLASVASLLPINDRVSAALEALSAIQRALGITSALRVANGPTMPAQGSAETLLTREGWSPATTLVKLFPYLPTADLHNAVFIAQQLEDPVERAEVLASLVPFLPDSIVWDLLTTELQLLGKNRPEMPGSVELDSYASGPERKPRIFPFPEDLWDQEVTIPAEGSPTWAQMGLASGGGVRRLHTSEPYLPATREAIENLASAFPRNLAGAALNWVRHDQFAADFREYVILGLIPRLAEQSNTEEILQVIDNVNDEQWLTGAVRALAVAKLAKCLPDLYLQLIPEQPSYQTMRLWDPDLRTRFLMSLLQEAPVPHKKVALSALMTFSGSSLMAKLLPWTVQLEGPNEAFRWSMRVIDRSKRLDALAAVVPYLLELSTGELYSLWQQIDASFSEDARQDVLHTLAILSPVIARLGGSKALLEVLHGIEDVVLWWP